MTELRDGDFDAFMTEVTGFAPFPWQRRLLREVLDTGTWPALLDLPTGTGKTSALLVGLYALALAPECSARRMVLVVDRRIIVDQVDAFARKINEALADAERPICTKVAARLRALSSSGVPLRVVHLRGGIPRDDSWVGAPDQPTIIASTVDQVGSRLLFRGYGVSEGMRPVHAGILARDTLYFLDEVHLATAFEETLRELEQRYASWSECAVGRPFRVVRMSATPRDRDKLTAGSRFGLDAEDRGHPLLSKRLNVSREATLEQVKTKQGNHPEVQAANRAALAVVACERARAAASNGARAIGVVVNRVDTARRIASKLGEAGLGEVLLITGRMRPFERTDIQARLGRTVAAGVERDADAQPTFVVATSCIEAGADLDFDALICEVASLDALRQRFGRLNRLGQHPATQAWVLACSHQLGAKAGDDPVYGAALRNTWLHLEGSAELRGKARVVDFGLASFVEPEEAEQLLPHLREAPVLFPSYLDMWAETRPAPHPDPDPSLWLHGKDQSPERDINVVFRADVPAQAEDDEFEVIAESLEFLPPVADEAVSVRLHEFVGFMQGLEHEHVWRWSGELERVALGELGVGDTVVLAAELGGLGRGTWDPESKTAVEDVAELAGFATRRLAKLRIDPATLPEALREGLPRPSDSDDPEAFEAARDACLSWLDGIADRVDDERWRELLQALAKPDGKRSLVSAVAADGRQVWRVTVVPRDRAIEATTEDGVSVFSGQPVTLREHLLDVEAWAGSFARAAGLAPTLARDVALAGLLHDLGKADLRFQALLRGGDAIGAATGEALAKSRQFGSLVARRRAERRSGWPGLRHELISLALLDASPQLQAFANDLELVRHLVASHHGWCRPWAPTTIDPEPMLVRGEVAGIQVEVSTEAIDDAFLSACASRFHRLCRRYGWHGLAYLEALLRLGDHRASARPGAKARPEVGA